MRELCDSEKVLMNFGGLTAWSSDLVAGRVGGEGRLKWTLVYLDLGNVDLIHGHIPIE